MHLENENPEGAVLQSKIIADIFSIENTAKYSSETRLVSLVLLHHLITSKMLQVSQRGTQLARSLQLGCDDSTTFNLLTHESSLLYTIVPDKGKAVAEGILSID